MNRMRVLFVEDDHFINMEILGILEDFGIFVTPVHPAEAAMSVIDSRGYLKLLLADIDLGKGADGFDVARHARNAYPDLPVVFVSGTAAARHAAEGVPGSVLVAKPFTPGQIRDALHTVLGLGPVGSQVKTTLMATPTAVAGEPLSPVPPEPMLDLEGAGAA
jgi:CheY-like chemotaxis protein